jgi:hypothetical protein
MKEYHGPYSLWVVELDDTMGIRVDETNSIRKLISSKRALYGILRYAKSIIYDKDSNVVEIDKPFMADGTKYDLTEDPNWLKGAK